MTPPLIETYDLSKIYGPLAALRECSFKVPSGEIMGLLGPNGAGKTTLIRLLLGYLQPSSGVAKVGGYNCFRQSEQVRQLTAYLPAETRLSRSLSGREVLDFFCRLRPGANFKLALQIAEQLELDLSRTVSRMSTGMRQKTALAMVLAYDTPLVILDEPTANLDPTARSTVLSLVRQARGSGRTVLFSSHVLSEVEDLCDRVAVLRAGELVHEQPLSELRKQHRIHLTLTGELPDLPIELRDKITITSLQQQRFRMDTPLELGPLLGWLATIQASEIRIEPVRLQTVYERFHSNVLA